MIVTNETITNIQINFQCNLCLVSGTCQLTVIKIHSILRSINKFTFGKIQILSGSIKCIKKTQANSVHFRCFVVSVLLT